MPEKEGSSSGLDPEQEKLLHRLGDRLTFLKEIDWLNKEQLGRSLVLVYPKKDNRPEKLEHVGSVLPLRKDNTRHLLILKNGDAFMMEPLLDRRPNANNKEAFESYKDAYAPNDMPLELGHSRLTGEENKDLGRLISWLKVDTVVIQLNRTRGLLRVDLDSYYMRALQLAKEEKEEREGRRDGSIVIFNAMMLRVFGERGNHFLKNEKEDSSEDEDPPSGPTQEPPPNVPPI